MKGKHREGLRKETPPTPHPLQIQFLRVCSVCGLPGSHPWGRGVTRAVCHSGLSGSLEAIAGHPGTLDIWVCWPLAYTSMWLPTSLHWGGAPVLHNSRG